MGSSHRSGASDRNPDWMALAPGTIAGTPAQWRIMGPLNEPIRPLTLDVSGLPSVAFGHRNTTWLANVFYMAIEGTMFALMFATYFYLRTRSSEWPPGHLPPALTYGTINAVVFLVSIIPAWWVRNRAPSGDRQAVRNGLMLLSAFAILATVLRIFEFTA